MPSNAPRRLPPAVGKAIVVAGLGIYAAALAVVTVGNHGQIRYTADSGDTIPLWQVLLPVAIGLGLMLLIPPGPPQATGARTFPRLRTEAFALLAAGLAFTIALTLLGPEEPRYILLKLLLLLIAPLTLFAATRRREHTPSGTVDPAASTLTRAQWRPLLPAAGWILCYLILSATRPSQSLGLDLPTLVAALAIGFLLNAVLEEVFYRRWLQTRWEHLLGGVWPAIILTSILWSSWHIAIQGGGNLGADLANVVANQGITGLFLGLLWARYRAMWPLLVIHGLMNANPLALL
ncbi:MAG: CPBP family intramembrane glutamic endopeptidase [Mycobacterium sp.]